MAPAADKDGDNGRKEAAAQEVEADEGFDSPSVVRAGGGEAKEQRRPSRSASRSGSDPEVASQSSRSNCSVSDSDSQPDSGTQALSDVEDELRRSPRDKDGVEAKAETLAECIVFSLLGKWKGSGQDDVERTLLRCVRIVMQKHEIFLKGMMKRLDITRETGYVSFVAVANELFEGEKMHITWGRIVALYAFGGQLALYCKEKNMEDFAVTIARFMGKYASEIVAPFVRRVGGWQKICEEYPAEDDLENKAWRFLTWTAIGLGIAATATFFTSH
ncbi:bcl-2-related ovarian killer protein-like [Penaeus japonicus]|uniref:bcl-2-related ovarian killer protein-like n=1 Tax=Penaeus japonicus TaxID=27405 RepID=UPI001C71427A|nr:bcl-2-related ovarian killer protein-like [Penaeus japonicus]